MEDYDDLTGFEGLYKINRGGAIWGCKHKRELTSQITRYGYYKIGLCKDGRQQFYRIHRLLALQYIPNDRPEIAREIDHINRIKTDNRLENLRWTTGSENCRNRTKNGCICRIRDSLQASWSYYEGDIRVIKTKRSKDRAVLEAWLEQMKIEYP